MPPSPPACPLGFETWSFRVLKWLTLVFGSDNRVSASILSRPVPHPLRFSLANPCPKDWSAYPKAEVQPLALISSWCLTAICSLSLQTSYSAFPLISSFWCCPHLPPLSQGARSASKALIFSARVWLHPILTLRFLIYKSSGLQLWFFQLLLTIGSFISVRTYRESQHRKKIKLESSGWLHGAMKPLNFS